jgi:hypothetical protein
MQSLILPAAPEENFMQKLSTKITGKKWLGKKPKQNRDNTSVIFFIHSKSDRDHVDHLERRPLHTKFLSE